MTFLELKSWLKENSKVIWFWLAIVLVYTFGRLPYLFMPHWNFDEGVYLSIGSDLNYGLNLYTNSWDHKPPILYWVYAILLKISGGQYFIIPLVNFFFGLAIIVLIYKFSKTFVVDKIAYFVTILATFFLATGFWESGVFNAESLFVPIIILSYLVFFKKENWLTNLLVGVLVFLATGIKIHAVFEFIGFFGGFLLINLSEFKNIVIRYFKIITVMAILWIAVLGSFAFKNELKFSFDSIFTYNTQYVETEDKTFANLLGVPIFNGKRYEPDRQGISQLQWRTIILVLFSILIIYFAFKTKTNSKYLWFFSWFGFTLYAILLSSRNYSHYLIQLVPVMAIGFGLLYSEINSKWKQNLNHVWKSTVFPAIVSFLIWLFLVQNVVFIFASGSNSSNVSLDVFPVEITYRDFYFNLSGGTLNKWQKEVQKNVYWYYPMDDIVANSKELTPVNGRFWHYSNISALCFYSQRQCGYTSHLWFHLEGTVLDQSLNNLKTRPPDTIFVDNTIKPNTEIQNFIQNRYKLKIALPDIFDGKDRYEYWVLK